MYSFIGRDPQFSTLLVEDGAREPDHNQCGSQLSGSVEAEVLQIQLLIPNITLMPKSDFGVVSPKSYCQLLTYTSTLCDADPVVSSYGYCLHSQSSTKCDVDRIYLDRAIVNHLHAP